MSKWGMAVTYNDDGTEMTLFAATSPEGQNGYLVTIGFPATRNELRAALLLLADNLRVSEFA